MNYEARKGADGWYVSGPGLNYWRAPHEDLARAAAALLNKQPEHAMEMVKRWES